MGPILLIVSARLTSGVLGYFFVVLTANAFTPAEFAVLAKYQTIIFLSQIVFDTGFLQFATREAARSVNELKLSQSLQSVRVGSSVAIGIVTTIGLAISNPTEVYNAVVCGLIIFTTAANADWILIVRQKRILWSAKVIASGLVNVAVVLLLLEYWHSITAILLGTLATNLFGAALLLVTKISIPSSPKLPTLPQLNRTLQYASSTAFNHLGYNTPILLATAFSVGVQAGKYSFLYRLFAAFTLLIPPALDFLVAKFLQELHSSNATAPTAKRCFRMYCLASILVSPILMAPSSLLYSVLSQFIDLGKFEIQPGDFVLVKVALLLFIIDFVSGRIAYLYDMRRGLILSGLLGLVATCIGLIISNGGTHQTAAHWFYVLYIFQGSSALVLLSTIVYRSRLATHHKNS